MDYKSLELISEILFVAAIVFFIVAIILFIVLKIPAVIGDLSGRNARNSISRMRAYNNNSGNRSYRASKTNAERGSITANIPNTGENNVSNILNTDGNAYDPETGLLTENIAHNVEAPTDLLHDPDETVLLDETPVEPQKRAGGVMLSMIDEVMLIHSDEVIF